VIDGGPWGDTNGYKTKLSVLQKAIENCEKLSITYHDREVNVTERVIEPYVIVFKQGLWYVYAYCNLRKDFRFFKTGRIESATLTKEYFTRKDITKMDLPLDFWHNTVEAEQIVMEISEKYLSDIEEWLGIENVGIENGKHIARVTLPYDDGLVSKIMSYGDSIKVLEPAKLTEKIKQSAESLIKVYK